MNTQPSVAGLLEFIKSQPADRPVRHETWNSCAVGDYAREVLGHEIAKPEKHSKWDGVDYWPVWSDPVLRALWEDAGSNDTETHNYFRMRVRRTGAPSLMDYLDANATGIRTYGDLSEKIETLVKDGEIELPA